jgi:Recombinase zinc beta ribbon domain
MSYPLSGMVFCADCGARMVGMKRHKTYPTYVCASHFRNRSCFSNSVRQENLLDVLKETMKEHLFHDGNWQALKTELLAQASQRPECKAEDREKVRKELEKAKSQHQRAAQNLLMADPQNVPALNAAMNELREKVKMLEARLAAAADTTSPETMVDEVLQNAKQLLEDLFTEGNDRVKAVLSEFVEKIELKYQWQNWGKRKLRTIAGGIFHLNPISLTSGQQGDSCLSNVLFVADTITYRKDRLWCLRLDHV